MVWTIRRRDGQVCGRAATDVAPAKAPGPEDSNRQPAEPGEQQLVLGPGLGYAATGLARGCFLSPAAIGLPGAHRRRASSTRRSLLSRDPNRVTGPVSHWWCKHLHWGGRGWRPWKGCVASVLRLCRPTMVSKPVARHTQCACDPLVSPAADLMS